MELHEQSIAQLSAGLHSGEVSSTELTTHMLQRIKAHDAVLNSFVTVTEELALEQAAAADARIAGGTAGPISETTPSAGLTIKPSPCGTARTGSSS